MSTYFSMFHVVGEIADILLMQEPDVKLLVDISQDLPGHETSVYRKYPNRNTFTIFDKSLIDRFLAQAKVGQVVELSGTFRQTNYVPHKTTYIDTIFTIDDFSFLRAKSNEPKETHRIQSDGPIRTLH